MNTQLTAGEACRRVAAKIKWGARFVPGRRWTADGPGCALGQVEALMGRKSTTDDSYRFDIEQSFLLAVQVARANNAGCWGECADALIRLAEYEENRTT